MGIEFEIDSLEDMCSLMCDNELPKRKVTQNNMILKDMLDGKVITGIDALNNYGCFRLPARISDIKKKGFVVKSKFIKVGASAKRVKAYWMGPEPDMVRDKEPIG